MLVWAKDRAAILSEPAVSNAINLYFMVFSVVPNGWIDVWKGNDQFAPWGRQRRTTTL